MRQRGMALFLMLCLLTPAALAGCYPLNEKGDIKTALLNAKTAGGFEIDFESLWKICADVVTYKTAMTLTTMDKTNGRLATAWLVEEGFGEAESTLRRRLDLQVQRNTASPYETYNVSVAVEKQTNRWGHRAGQYDEIIWRNEGNDKDLEDKLLRLIYYRFRAVKEARALKMPDPDFHDFKLGQ